jgi:hypothetical protein
MAMPQPGTNGSPRGRPERCGLENPPTGTKGHFAIFKYFQKKFQIILVFLNFPIFGFLICLTIFPLISNHHPYSHVKVYTRGPISRPITHPHTAPPSVCLTSPFLPY